jgi:hypothetical protein
MRRKFGIKLIAGALAALALQVPTAAFAQGNGPARIVVIGGGAVQASSLEGMIVRLQGGDLSALVEMRERMRSGDTGLIGDVLGSLIGDDGLLVELIDTVLDLLLDPILGLATGDILGIDVTHSVPLLEDLDGSVSGLHEGGLLSGLLEDIGLADLLADILGIDILDILDLIPIL